MRYFISIIALIGCCIFSSCEDFLEAEPKDTISESEFWKSEDNISKFVTDIYATSFPSIYEGSIFFDEAMSDNSFLVWTGWYTNVRLVANGTQDAYGTVPYNIWSQQYSNIRKCWQVFENISNTNFSDPTKKDILLAEVRFLLAYNYNRLINFFGDVPFVKKVLTVEESKSIPRVNKSEIISFIHEELDKAITTLSGKKVETGRVSWGACIALKARVDLNQNNYGGVYNVTKELLGKYNLHTDGETPFFELFSGNAENSSEIIFSIRKDKTTGSTKTGHYANEMFLLKGMSGGDAFRAITPCGSLVDAYPMSDGRLIHEKGSSYDPKNPYLNRDPRLAQSIIYPTGNIKYLDSETNSIKKTLYDPENSTTIAAQQYNAKEPSPTGYMWNKYVDWSVYAMNEIRDCANDIIIFRYAEVLLMYAESLVELNGVSSKGEIIEVINMLRNRCKCGEVHAENYNTKEDLRFLVRNERRVELANEGLRYFDLLRWKIAEKEIVKDYCGLKGDLYGAYMRLDGIGSGDKTVLVDGVPRRFVEERFFNPEKHYLQPIPQKEIDLNEQLKQNPNW